MSNDSEYVLVLDVEVVTVVKTSSYTIRPHEGDKVSESGEAGDIKLAFGPRKDRDGRDLPGTVVLIPAAHMVEMTRAWRYEKRVRLTPAAVVDRQRAEVKALAQKLGVDKPTP
jgi:hypothetical protein